jgi:hypothetical protein
MKRAKYMRRFSAGERAIHRHHVWLWTAIWQRGFDEIAFAAAQEYIDRQTAFRAIAKAAVSANTQVVASIIGEFLKEKVFPKVLAELQT